MKRATVGENNFYGLALLMLFFGVLGQMLWVAMPMAQDPSSGHFLFARDADQLAPFVPTPQEVVNRMLELAELKPGDVVYDLGSGDGRIVITAASRYGVKAVGFEINPLLVKESRERIREAGLEYLVEIREQDLRDVDLSPASVVTLYLYPAATLRLRSVILRQMKPGSRVLSHNYAMGNWQPDRIEKLTDATGLSRTIYLWRIVENR
jgi:SAM-dependent methyltransferase